MITDEFMAVAGTVIGTEHRRLGKNNQDGYFIAANGYVLSAAISDGCSSSISSEVGAKLLSRFIAEEALKLIMRECVIKGSEIMERLEENAIKYMKNILSRHQNPESALDEMFLATIVGVIMNDYFATIYAIGDGVYALNGEIGIIDESNMPNYPAYKVLPGNYEVDESKIKLRLKREVFTDDVESILIATDGANDLIRKAGRTINILGKEEKVKGLNQFEKEEKYLRNPTLLQKRLTQLNTERTSIDWENREINKFEGILSDDTTIILIKRKDPAQISNIDR
ncbi:MAG: hypothetical protein A3J63_01970 [Candidatus Moranbacteria bacterium RIFCSPHIGHO2_02_FULL_40_12b]|nr:MAG: hypothetical protein A3J63_01970 [Candidatus Moranbacteria bacterium RIFCSPHIGHO2_02_FULL_40_12b]